MHFRGELDIDKGKHVLACFETRNYFKWILKQLINSELSRRMLSTSADNTLLDLHNSSYPTQPHSLIANYPICCIFCPVLPMFLKGWSGQPKIFFFFKTPMRHLDCFCPSGYMWYTPAMAWLGGCEGSLSGLLKKCVGNIFVSKASLFLSLFFAAWSLRPHYFGRPMRWGSRGLTYTTEVNWMRGSGKTLSRYYAKPF